MVARHSLVQRCHLSELGESTPQCLMLCINGRRCPAELALSLVKGALTRRQLGDNVGSLLGVTSLCWTEQGPLIGGGDVGTHLGC